MRRRRGSDGALPMTSPAFLATARAVFDTSPSALRSWLFSASLEKSWVDISAWAVTPLPGDGRSNLVVPAAGPVMRGRVETRTSRPLTVAGGAADAKQKLTVFCWAGP